MDFKELSPKQKAQFIWDYYKIHIIAAVVIAGIAIWGINHFILHPEPAVCCGIAIYGPHIDIDTTDAIEEMITAKITEPDENLKAEITNFFFTGGEGEDKLQDRDMLDKFYTYLYALQLDIFIGNEEDTQACIKADFLSTVDDYITPEQKAEFEKDGRLLYGKDSDDEEELPYAVKITDNAFLKSFDILRDDTYYIAFVPIDGREEKAKKAGQLFLTE
ncbi:MAG: hypothetical protein IJR59_00940 [Firmicutes bacterium]|nr:hypothetical protein [Bacillota bacterium]